jgi:proteasome lid subunit RPN8/RPN11
MLFIDPITLAELKTEGIRIFPDECCGFLLGSEEADGTRTISRIRVVDNAKSGDKKRRFEISPKDYMLAEKFALENDLELLGIYHSHPNHPAIPSEHDRVAAQPWFSYVIISVMAGQFDHVRSWRLNDISQFEEENISSVHLNKTT